MAAVADHQPISRDGPKDIFARHVSRDLIGQLHALDPIATGPRKPRRHAPNAFVATKVLPAAVGVASLCDLHAPSALGRYDIVPK